MRFTSPTGHLGRLLLGLATFLLACPAPAQEHADVPRVTRTFAIEQARIVQAPGRTLERGTFIIRDGLIEAVGPDVPVPFDAERIPGDSLVVYAGSIDGLSHIGIPEPQQVEDPPRVDEPGNPPNDRAGIQPERDVLTLLNPADTSVTAFRRAGFTAAHVVPRGTLLPGSGALILLAGDAAEAMVLQHDASLFAQFTGARGDYPATPMAVMAKLRQLYREARRRQQAEALYAANAAGLERPPYDPVHHALFPVIAGTKPVFFYTESALEVHRALHLQQELNLPLALAGLNQGFDAVDALKAAGDVPLFLTLKLPEEPKAESTAIPTAPTKS